MYISSVPPDKNKKRYEVHFLPDQAAVFERLAREQHRSVKNLLETLLLDSIKDEAKPKKSAKK